MTVGERIKLLMDEHEISQNKLAKRAQISQSGLSSILSGASSPKENTLQAIAKAFDCTVAELLGESSSSFIPMVKNALPVIGEIVCGTPITEEQNIEGYQDIPAGVHADFALRCRGDSMSPTFLDGDLVLIRQQPDVEDGQIAAIFINGEATLKHVYHQKDALLLTADNPAFAPMTIPITTGEFTAIQGLAVGYVRMF